MEEEERGYSGTEEETKENLAHRYLRSTGTKDGRANVNMARNQSRQRAAGIPLLRFLQSPWNPIGVKPVSLARKGKRAQ
jgi:hypothetical protein